MDGERKAAFGEPAAEPTAGSKIVKCAADKRWGDGRTDKRAYNSIPNIYNTDILEQNLNYYS